MPDLPIYDGNGERRAYLARVMMWIAIISTAINMVGATTFWFSLPEKFKTITASVAALEIRVQAQETRSVVQESTLARIDERTKNIQENVSELKHDFSMRANGNPNQ